MAKPTNKTSPKTTLDHFSKENLNPLSSKGRLAFSTFGLSLGAIVLFNLVVWAALRSQLLPARLSLDRERALAYYIVWFIFATVGFTAVTNTFIKRWACISGDRDLSPSLKSLIRLSLLSPLLAYPLTIISFLFFPRSPLLEVDDGGSKAANLSIMIGALVLSIAASTMLPASMFGLERLEFRTSMKPVNEVVPTPFPFPKASILKPLLAAATPGLRYFFWLGADAYRTRSLNNVVSQTDSPLCKERLSFIGVEVKDCYFSNLRKMATVAPLVSPYFALYFESMYRQNSATEFKMELEDKLAEKERKLAEDPTFVSGDGTTIRTGFAFSLLMLSNQLELLEAGPMFVDRTHFLSPAALLHAYGSPEFPFVEAGQDIQRVSLVQKLLPIFQFQLDSVRGYLETSGRVLGAEEVTVGAEVRDLQTRIAAVKRDPLMIGKK
ncbi:hypothetical protein BH10BDE1_BH10BDE1_09970 [soil metagenome]